MDTTDPTPPYEQIRRQIAAAIEQGAFEVGAKLPSVRQLANDLGIATGTVARAYRELEHGGLIHSRRGQGTTVLASPRPTADLLEEQTLAYIAQARALGVDDDTIVAAVARSLG
ncbi:GntR family transcriptional regulator [Gordonia sp. CPCC 205333]|uniref:GntR family transcriptional regulator n=1 Tax=Gordonia sp. CPCC 205333 TaxID=3140790 RepID=UPI003AF3BA54